ncbi:MAG: hypothetical protein HKN30_05065 [Sulfitobacter sp.]|nr:hypothetical protein [Sulfitobacter sp.]
MTIATVLIWALTAFLVLASLLPLSKLPYGAIRGLAFPREQFFVLAILLIPAVIYFQPGGWGRLGAVLLIGVALIQLLYIVKFTPFWGRQSLDAPAGLSEDEGAKLSLIAANVKMSNRAYRRLIQLAKDRQPDILMAIEVDEDWLEALKQGLEEEYPHWVEVPQDNGYGLCLMSRLELSEVDVRYLITEGVPSIRTMVTLRNGESVRLYVVHPEPPVIDHDTAGRDSEIAQVGLEALNDPLPAIVTGDLNDVAWSTTTRLFQRLSRLLDPRVGRGFFNTFSATMPWFRWPLDHLFHDARFRLIAMERLEKIGSDHFPMWFVLALAETEDRELSPGSADPAEKRETEEMIDRERSRDRDPIGSDWEKEQE